MQQWNAFYELINSDSKRFVILTHQNPDADAIGSSLGWKLYLQKKGHTATVIVPNECPSNLRWMPDYAEVITFDQNAQTVAQSKKLLQEADVICCLDFNALHRIKGLGSLAQSSEATKILIDHHLEPESFADFEFSDTTKAATAQYIWEIIKQMGDAELVDKPMAECLYAGIMTDTGSFRHGNTTPEVHLAVADLMRTGLNTNYVHRAIFDNNSLGRTRLLGYVLSEKLTWLPEYRTVYMTLSLEELKRFNSEIGDTEGIVNFGLSLENVVMSVLLIERRDEIKLSFRSVQDFSVRELANKYFSGGGHKNASGGRTNTSLPETVNLLLSILPEYQTQLLNVEK
ncbi:DHH family phosphoesterase [Runella salmonicolor]|uniref:Bifunctional oligoribonuclease/PAP phosphatase NrnA n=1 Tax=Runella salmonicolor TaxID=2950278 RepID=A0ABT1FVC2_9BACT|nr:bifunctional oligoribonuclease/PAP phosphatase NrnA [Runella salmonicolor]MCP1385415.1 bifunctional oligoribonuclease/PAP phosphatase NrnA [Runella salmonicolor]